MAPPICFSYRTASPGGSAPLVENTHAFHVAVSTPTGAPLWHAGDPTRATLVRSAAKPVQALAILQTGCFSLFPLDDADLALMCASHSSREAHISRARGILAKAGAAEADLQCGAHAAIDPAVQEAWVRSGTVPSPVYSNCSGKHAGMLAGARALPPAAVAYHLPEHPMQGAVRALFAQLLRGREGGLPAWATDGCNLPAPAMQVADLAFVYAQFADRREAGMQRVFDAMAAFPALVGGEGRFCTVLMQAFAGTLIGKVGADGCYGVGVSAAAPRGEGAPQGAFGVGVKVEDGSMEVSYMVVVEVLCRLGVGNEGIWEKLGQWRRPRRYNTAGVDVGGYGFELELERAG